MKVRCSAWGCKSKATTHAPDPQYADQARLGLGVPWYPTCGLPIYRSRSGLTITHGNVKG